MACISSPLELVQRRIEAVTFGAHRRGAVAYQEPCFRGVGECCVPAPLTSIDHPRLAPGSPLDTQKRDLPLGVASLAAYFLCLQVCLIKVRPVEGAGNKVRPVAEALHLFSSSLLLVGSGLALQLVHRREVEVARVLIRPRLYDAQSDGAGCPSRPRRLKRKTRTPMSPSSSSAYWEVTPRSRPRVAARPRRR